MSGSRYESFRVATLALVFTWMRLQVIKEGAESVDGLSPVERGFERWRPALQLGVRTLAQIGFCSAAIIRRVQCTRRARPRPQHAPRGTETSGRTSPYEANRGGQVERLPEHDWRGAQQLRDGRRAGLRPVEIGQCGCREHDLGIVAFGQRPGSTDVIGVTVRRGDNSQLRPFVPYQRVEVTGDGRQTGVDDEQAGIAVHQVAVETPPRYRDTRVIPSSGMRSMRRSSASILHHGS